MTSSTFQTPEALLDLPIPPPAPPFHGSFAALNLPEVAITNVPAAPRSHSGTQEPLLGSALFRST